jgi:hypothetical protein
LWTLAQASAAAYTSTYLSHLQCLKNVACVVGQHPMHAKKIFVDVVAIHRVVQVFTKNIVELSAENQANRLGFAQSKPGKLLTNISDSSATMLDVVSCQKRLASAKMNFAKRFCTI